MHTTISERSDHRYFVNVQFVNRISVPEDGFAGPSEHLFQPEIRVIVTSGELIPGFSTGIPDPEDEKLAFLYEKRHILGRGHLCSAIWRSIDPQIETLDQDVSKIEFFETMKSPPFYWVDGESLGPHHRARFSRCDLRTDYPYKSQHAPDFRWPEGHGAAPELVAEKLAWQARLRH